MKLVHKISLVFIAGTTSILALYGYESVQREVEIFQTERTTDVRQVGRMIRSDMERIASASGLEQALEFVKEADEEEKPLRIRWVWFDVAAGDPRAPDIARIHEAPAEPRFGFEGSDRRGEARYYLYFPARLPGGRSGALEVSRLVRRVAEYTSRAFHSIVAMTLLAAAGSGAIAMGVGGFFVGRPVRNLVLQARRVGAGDFSARLPVRTGDELGELAREMNVMCDRLADARSRLTQETQARITMLEQLRLADRLSTVGTLAAGIAHELGTPLNVIAGRARMIASGEVESDEARDNARIVVEQTERMTKIIRQLLDFARPRPPERTRQDAYALTRDTLDLLGPLAKKRGVELVLTPPEVSALAEVDAGQFQQALTNLVVNAIQAVSDESRVEVSLSKERATPPKDSAAREGEFLRVAVRDHGPGIDEASLARVFEPFFTTKDVGEGTGLGLPVSYGIVREHGGWIGVESTVGAGSCFSIFLPSA